MMASTTENVFMSSTAEQNVEQTTKTITSTDAITTNQTNEASTSIPTQAMNAESDTTKQTEKPSDAISQSNEHAKSSISLDSVAKTMHEKSESTSKIENMERVSITYATYIPTTTTTAATTTASVDSETETQEEQTKSSSTSTTSPFKKLNENDRRPVVSKDDIESIRGRALNFTSSENPQQQQKFSGIVYVTAPTTSSLLSKSSKSFQNDLSNVDMDVDDNFHNNEHLASATTTIPLIHESDKSNKTSPPLLHNSG